MHGKCVVVEDDFIETLCLFDYLLKFLLYRKFQIRNVRGVVTDGTVYDFLNIVRISFLSWKVFLKGQSFDWKPACSVCQSL